MSSGQLILVSAPSGAGKTSLVNAALQVDQRLVVSVSHTTRRRRRGEVEGVNYHFVEQAQFQQMIDQQAFLEHAKVFGNHYGTAKEQVAQLRSAGRDVILEIDWQGAGQVRKLLPEALSIFVMPPTAEDLAQRLRKRGADSADSIETRLAEARLEMSKAGSYQYIVVNDDFQTALADMLAVIRARRLRAAEQLSGNAQVKAILGSGSEN